jgi:hypothetical protein
MKAAVDEVKAQLRTIKTPSTSSSKTPSTNSFSSCDDSQNSRSTRREVPPLPPAGISNRESFSLSDGDDNEEFAITNQQGTHEDEVVPEASKEMQVFHIDDEMLPAQGESQGNTLFTQHSSVVKDIDDEMLPAQGESQGNTLFTQHSSVVKDSLEEDDAHREVEEEVLYQAPIEKANDDAHRQVEEDEKDKNDKMGNMISLLTGMNPDQLAQMQLALRGCKSQLSIAKTKVSVSVAPPASLKKNPRSETYTTVNKQAKTSHPSDAGSLKPAHKPQQAEVACNIHGVVLQDLKHLDSQRDIRHLFRSNEDDAGLLHGTQCHGGCQWPFKGMDFTLAGSKMIKPVYYCMECDLAEKASEGPLDFQPFFLCAPCQTARLPISTGARRSRR